MSNMNSALSSWQLVIMAVVPLTALVGWIVTIFIVAREPRRPYVAAAPAAPTAPPAPAASAGAAASGTAVPTMARASETEPRAKEPVAA